jgi:hypothetical protein
MLLEVSREELRVLRRALEARAREMQLRLGSEPGDEAYRREANSSARLLKTVEALERSADHATGRTKGTKHQPGEHED